MRDAYKVKNIICKKGAYGSAEAGLLLELPEVRDVFIDREAQGQAA